MIGKTFHKHSYNKYSSSSFCFQVRDSIFAFQFLDWDFDIHVQNIDAIIVTKHETVLA